MTSNATGRRLRMLHIASGRDWSGRHMQALALMTGLAAKGHHPTLAAHESSRLLAEARARNIETTSLPAGWLRQHLALRRVIGSSTADLVHLHDTSALVTAARACTGLVTPSFILGVGGDVAYGGRAFATDRLTARVTQFWAVSEWVWSALVRNGIPEEKIAVVHSGVDLDRFTLDQAAARSARDVARRRLGIEPEAFVVGCMMRLCADNGLANLARACHLIESGLLPPADPAIRLLVIGDGPDRGMLERSVAGAWPGGKVIWAGWSDDVATLLPALDLYADPRPAGDGFPVSLREAMALGLPSLATDLMGIREIIDNGRHGLIVPASDPEALARNIMKLRRDPELTRRMGHAGSLKVQRYSLRAMVDRAEELYFRLVR